MEAFRVGKNDPCPCNSGKKYRQCCWLKRFDWSKPKPGLLGDGANTQPNPPTDPSQSKIRASVGYTFSDGIGIGEVTYCFDLDQEFLLTNGLVVTADKVEVGMEFFLEGGMVATVTCVKPPEEHPPLPTTKDAYGNSAKRVIGTVKYSGHYPVMDLVVGDRYMKTTPGHRFYSVDRGGWVEAESLAVGELVETEYRVPTPVTSVSPYRFEYIELFNWEVEDSHTYFVGRAGETSVWSHNGLQGGCAIPKPARAESGKLVSKSKATMSSDPQFGAGYDAVFGNRAGAVRKTLSGRLPKEGENGSWHGTTPGNGVWRSTDLRVRRAVTKPGEAVPPHVDVQFKNGYPIFDGQIRTVHGVKGTTKITLDTDATAGLRTRADRDFATANRWLADQLNQKRVLAPDGGAWSVTKVKKYLKKEGMQWHHHEDMTTMQLLRMNYHDNIPHLGGRSLKDFSFDPPLRNRSRVGIALADDFGYRSARHGCTAASFRRRPRRDTRIRPGVDPVAHRSRRHSRNRGRGVEGPAQQ
ncbi:MAG: HNH endonuclease [Planctomycetia bacterium]|nr:HNH endonuclease [Planctomycetia bacterium]